jgi:hypothetical protein
MLTSTKAPLDGRVFRGADTVRHGLLTSDQLRTDAWIRLRHDVYADARLKRDHELACRGALARLPASTVFAGPSAAFLHGLTHAATYADDVHVITPLSVRVGSQRSLRVHRLDLAPDEMLTIGAHTLTSPSRTAWDVARWLAPLDAVPIVDALLNRHLTTVEACADHLARQRGRHGWRRAGTVYALADPGARTPAESRLRLLLIRAGLPRPAAQCPVQVSPAQVVRADLGWERWRVAMEHDGHLDRRRHRLLVTAGWTVVRVTGGRLRTDFPGVVHEVGNALAARGWRGQGQLRIRPL